MRWKIILIAVILVIVVGIFAANITGFISVKPVSENKTEKIETNKTETETTGIKDETINPPSPITGHVTNKTTNTTSKTTTPSGGGGGGGSGGGGGGTDGNPRPPQPQYNANVFLNPTSKNVNTNGTFSVNVDIETNKEIYGYEFVLSFNPTILNVESVNEGTFLKKDGATTFPITMINNTLGEIVVAVAMLGVDSGVSGSGTIVTVNFKGKNSGTTILDLKDVNLEDPNASKISDVLVTDGSVSVG